MRTDLKHYKTRTKEFNGIYRGVIEDNNDPEMLGRCKVRVWGLHTDVKEENELEGIPTPNLPWAEPCLGLVEGSVSGHGMFSIPLQGSHVFLFFEGGNWQSPRYFATVPGQPEEAPDTTKGFNDPSGTYPRADRIGESDYHRLFRGESSGTIVDHKDANLDLDVPIALTGPQYETWDEPESAYAAEYPDNIVLSTHGGLLIELDSTAGKERVHVFHPSNTYIEIDVDGNVVFRNDGNRFEITRQNRNKHVLIDDNETVDVDKTSKVGNDEFIEIGHNREKQVGNDDRETIGKDRTTTIGQNDTEIVGTDKSTTIGNDDTKTVGGDWTVTVEGDITFQATGDIRFNSGPSKKIYLNS